MEILAETGTDAYLTLLEELIVQGERSAPRGMPTREIRDVTVRIEDAVHAHVLGTTRKVNRRIAAVETIQLLGGISNLAQLDAVSSNVFSKYADGGRLRGAYGPRTASQLVGVVKLLERDPDTRQAVVTVWNGYEQLGSCKDIPCTQAFQFFVRRGKLHMRVAMRSSDIFLGVPYDWMMFSRLQLIVAAHLGLEPGTYTHVAGSQHLYDTNLADSERIIEVGAFNGSGFDVPPPLLGKDDPAYLGGSIQGGQLARSQYLAIKLGLGKVGEPEGQAETDAVHLSEDLDWYLSHVPQLEGQGLCRDCRYVIDDSELIIPHADDVHYRICRECEMRRNM